MKAKQYTSCYLLYACLGPFVFSWKSCHFILLLNTQWWALKDTYKGVHALFIEERVVRFLTDILFTHCPWLILKRKKCIYRGLKWLYLLITIKIYTRRNLFFYSTEHLKYMEMYMTEAFRFQFTADDRPNFLVNIDLTLHYRNGQCTLHLCRWKVEDPYTIP